MDIKPLYPEHITGIDVKTENTSYLHTHGYAVNPKETWLVTSGENGYIVQRVETTSVPFSRADVVSDATRIYTCTCPSYRFREGLHDLSEREELEWDACKHIEKVDKSVKAINDEKQTSL